MSFLTTLLHHPRKLWLRRALFQIHLWVGVLLSLYVVTIALTGSVLVFRSEFTRASLPKTLTPYDPTRIVPLIQVVRGFQEVYPGATLNNIQTPSKPLPAFVLTATDVHQHPSTMLADPVTASLFMQPPSWLDWIYDLHVYLLLSHVYGMQVNGLGAAGLLLLTLSGLFLWWSGLKLWVRGLGISFRHNWRRINYDLHNAIGFWTLFILFWWALSGIYFAWYRQVTAVITVMSPLRGMRSPVPLSPLLTAHGHASLDQILTAIQQASPQGRLSSLSDPSLSSATIYALVDRRAPGRLLPSRHPHRVYRRRSSPHHLALRAKPNGCRLVSLGHASASLRHPLGLRLQDALGSPRACAGSGHNHRSPHVLESFPPAQTPRLKLRKHAGLADHQPGLQQNGLRSLLRRFDDLHR